MDGMPIAAHAKPAPKRDHLWVLAVIAICALFEVWVSWVTIGSMSGFPKIGGEHGLPTAWTLAVTSEAYWGYALYAWLAGAPGPRSRRFAMWSFAVVFVLSLIGQGASHLVPQGTVPPPEVVVFITSLPVVVLALIAVLVHLRQLDREEAAETEERSAVRAEMDTLRAERDTAVSDLAAARTELAEAVAKAEVLAQKLARASGQKRTRKSPPKKAPASTPETPASSPPEVQVPEDVDTQAAALEILAKEPDISGSELGRRLGKSERYGCMLKRDLAGSAPGGN